MDEQRFRTACLRAAARPGKGIGTMGEKTLHAVLKYYFEPFEGSHETKIGGYISDITGENGIIEIQTRNFDKLRKKLDAFLPLVHVTVVYPVPRTKWLVWVDRETGEAAKKRKSPKTGTPYEVFFELYKIKSRLLNPNLSLCVVMLDLEEYRYLDGWSADRKKGSTRCDRIPLAIVGEIMVDGPGDYGRLMPAGLAEPFTSGDFQKASGLTLSASQTALNVLNYVGAVTRVGRRGNRFLYCKNTQKEG